MEQKLIETIKVKDNIRKDYGDLTELTASIKLHGVRKPVELSTDNELIDGFRRLKAAKAAGLEKIPYFYADEKIDTTTTQLISGIFQKNLNPIEEGMAFKKYMDKCKYSEEYVAKQISKKVNYIKKRLLLIDLPEDVQKALIEKKIRIGHALLLAKMPKGNSRGYLRRIISDGKGVKAAQEDIQYGGFAVNLKEASFDKSECKHCKFNGSEQAELFETGTILNGNCMNPNCFRKKAKEFVKQKSEQFKDILFKGESDYDYPDRSKYFDGESEWTCKEKGITNEYKKQCRKSKDYLVKISENGKVTEYFKIPTKKKSSGEIGDAKVKEQDIVRKDKLINRVSVFKREFLIKKSIEFMQPGTKEAKVLTLIKLMRTANWDNLTKDFYKIVGGEDRSVKNFYKLEEKEIDKAISHLSRRAFREVDLKELVVISRNFKVDVKKHFVITKEYLELYTKAQLIDLITEFKLYVDAKELEGKTISAETFKKGELIQHILNQDLKGRVPKILM